MSAAAIRFPYRVRDLARPEGSLAPLLPVLLAGAVQVEALALLDTGAAVNVLPHSLGVRLGCDWTTASAGLRLTGNLAALEARGVLLAATVGTFPETRLAFAWTRTDEVPLLFGQVNFFQEFDVCFFRARQCFEVRPRG